MFTIIITKEFVTSYRVDSFLGTVVLHSLARICLTDYLHYTRPFYALPFMYYDLNIFLGLNFINKLPHLFIPIPACFCVYCVHEDQF